MSTRRRGRPQTLHFGSSEPVADVTRDLVRVLLAERALPAEPRPISTQTMLAVAARIAAGEPAQQFEADKTAEWLARFPTKADAAQIGYRHPATRQAIADRVLLAGEDRDQVAADYQTNRATVDAIVAAAQDGLRRYSA